MAGTKLRRGLPRGRLGGAHRPWKLTDVAASLRPAGQGASKRVSVAQPEVQALSGERVDGVGGITAGRQGGVGGRRQEDEAEDRGAELERGGGGGGAAR